MSDPAAIALTSPGPGWWLVQNSPASRIPSHGTALFGSSFAIDLVPVDARGRSAPRTWRSALATEHPASFVGFGRPILAPVSGVVESVHDGEPDHEARRSPLALLGYALTQRSRIRGGAPAIAGNHVVIRVGEAVVLLAHLRKGSIRVRAGDRVIARAQVGECGNSGNSTEPHLHVQASVSLGLDARGLPIVFLTPAGERRLPVNGEVVRL